MVQQHQLVSERCLFEPGVVHGHISKQREMLCVSALFHVLKDPGLNTVVVLPLAVPV